MTLSTPAYRGKVRDIYQLGDRLMIIASDRLSAFDVVFHEPIPGKGKILTAIAAYWFELPEIRAIIPNHFLSNRREDFPDEFHAVDSMEGNAMLVRRAERIDIECVVRGYLAGSAHREYVQHGTVHGEKLPAGLRESEKLPKPIFTPATKADSGHDENISFAAMKNAVGVELSQTLRQISLALFNAASAHAADRGLILADTKFEFGWIDGRIALIDEIFTPDSSRWWSAESYRPGAAQEPFDKQFVRDYLETLDWNKTPPPPALPEHVIHGTLERYREAFQLITGRRFVSW